MLINKVTKNLIIDNEIVDYFHLTDTPYEVIQTVKNRVFTSRLEYIIYQIKQSWAHLFGRSDWQRAQALLGNNEEANDLLKKAVSFFSQYRTLEQFIKSKYETSINNDAKTALEKIKTDVEKDLSEIRKYFTTKLNPEKLQKLENNYEIKKKQLINTISKLENIAKAKIVIISVSRKSNQLEFKYHLQWESLPAPVQKISIPSLDFALTEQRSNRFNQMAHSLFLNQCDLFSTIATS